MHINNGRMKRNGDDWISRTLNRPRKRFILNVAAVHIAVLIRFYLDWPIGYRLTTRSNVGKKGNQKFSDVVACEKRLHASNGSQNLLEMAIKQNEAKCIIQIETMNIQLKTAVIAERLVVLLLLLLLLLFLLSSLSSLLLLTSLSSLLL